MEYYIHWNNLAEATYLYGSKLSKKDGKTIFENPLMPPGLEVKKWVAMTNFQANRTIPSLPRLRQGKTYTIELSAETYPKNSLYIKIEFFNYYKEHISSIIIKELQGSFEFPTETYNYEVSLINAGCEKIIFQHIKITDSNETAEEDWEDLSGETLDILFLESPIEDGHLLDPTILEKFSHIMVIDDVEEKQECYLSNDFSDKLITYIQNIKPSTIRFIGYGPISNLAAIYYTSCFMEQSTAYITEDVYTSEKYKNFLLNSTIDIDELLHFMLHSKNSNTYDIELEASLQSIKRLYGANIYLKSLPYITQGGKT